LNVTLLARGPVCAREQAVLDALPITIGTPAALACVTGLQPAEVEDALAQLTRRGLISRYAGRVRATPQAGRRPRQRPRRAPSANTPTPTLPAA
jgi:hypothetical protein